MNNFIKLQETIQKVKEVTGKSITITTSTTTTLK
jgi:hypothetical protein